MGSRSRRKKRDRLAAIVDLSGSVKPRAVATPHPQTNMQGVWGESESGLHPAEELQLVAQSLHWLNGQRFPTHTPINQIKNQAQTENRRLTAPELVVATAGRFLDSGNEMPTSFRDALRKQRLMLKACKIIIGAEDLNQAQDYKPADLPE